MQQSSDTHGAGGQSTKKRSDVCFFTIVSNNYLHYAGSLFESLLAHCPQADRVLGLCDLPLQETRCEHATDLIDIRQLGIPELATFAYQYSILELNTAIKPYLAEKLMQLGYRKVIYFDPDIYVHGSLDEMLALLDRHNVLLTPHLTGPLDDNKWPTELSILQAGSYNLGFIALRNSEESLRLLRWWQAKLYKECVVDLPRNLFVDQKWMDLAPSLFDGVYIQRDPGWNLAYWNLNHRPLQRSADGHFQVLGKPLTFFHFSGFSLDANTLSKHQNRFDKGAKGTPLRELCTQYEQSLLRNGHQRCAGLPYAFQLFADGTPVPDAARRLIRNDSDFAGIDLFEAQHCERLHAQLNRRIRASQGGIALTAVAKALWEMRVDLRNAFPAIDGADSVRFVEWALHTAAAEAGFSERYLKPLREELERYRARLQGSPEAPRRSLLRKVLQVAWRQRRKIPLSLRIALAPYAAPVLRRAYPRPQLPAHASSDAPGVNLIGYLHAESGIGEAARASLRALRQSELPFSTIDYRLGNISRMSETVEASDDDTLYPVNLIHVNADQSRVAREHLGEALFHGRYTLGYWFWEMPAFPDFLHFAYEQVDEVLVASEYNRRAIAACTDKPVTLIPPAIEVRLEPLLKRKELGVDEDAFVFLHISDALSIPQRKNPLGAVEAFRQAFGAAPDADVRLLLKVSNLEHHPELATALRAAAASDPRIRLLEGYLERNVLNNLINACDCYVSLHRAEGFGLPIAEAMYLGKPVIATHWSGNADFMDADNSLPVRYELIELDEDIGPYSRGQHWAEPDLQDAAQKMRMLVASADLAVRLGERAAQSIRQRYSPQAVGRLLDQRVRAIAEARG